VLVRRLNEAAVEEWHRLRSHILMDAGELGSRNMSVTWLEVPADVEQSLHSHEDAEQVYVVVSGTGRMCVAGDWQDIAEGDLVLIPPATDHMIGSSAEDGLALVSVQSPPVAVSELYGRQMAEVAGYDDEDEY
jgi:mannose-6-phosphate isomerase-like protein (cupin superfamily)